MLPVRSHPNGIPEKSLNALPRQAMPCFILEQISFIPTEPIDVPFRGYRKVMIFVHTSTHRSDAVDLEIESKGGAENICRYFRELESNVRPLRPDFGP